MESVNPMLVSAIICPRSALVSDATKPLTTCPRIAPGYPRGARPGDVIDPMCVSVVEYCGISLGDMIVEME